MVKTSMLLFSLGNLSLFVAVSWLPSNPLARIHSPAGTTILIYILGLGVCPLCSVLCCLRRWPINCAGHTFKEARLEYLSIVLVQSP